MHFAVNYSPQAATLLQDKSIVFDIFKCPDWPEVVKAARQLRPVYVHFPLRTRLINLQAVDWVKIETFLVETDTQYINIHAAPHADDFPGMPQDTRDPKWQEKVEESVIISLQMVIDRFGRDNVILENVPWDRDPDYSIPRPVIEPGFMNRVVNETGCGFLLDTAHARVSALHLGLDQIDYLDGLPTNHLKEVHITGTANSSKYGCLVDHFAMTKEDWSLAVHSMELISAGIWPQPEIVALEYGGVGPLFEWRSELEVLATDVPKLYGLVQAAQTPKDRISEI